MDFIIRFLADPTFYPVSVVVGLASVWVISKIFPGWVKFTYDIKLEKARRELLRREKASVIADLTVLMAKGGLSEEDRVQINKHLLDLCLCLPPYLIHNLAHTYCKSGTQEDLNPLGLFVRIRGFIDGTDRPTKEEKKRALTWDNIPQLQPIADSRPKMIQVNLPKGKVLQIDLNYKQLDQAQLAQQSKIPNKTMDTNPHSATLREDRSS